MMQSLRHLSALGDVQTIYVDSASSDDSVELVSNCFDQVVRLKDSPYLNASAARHVGTKLALGTWILYLDADMSLRKEFIPVIQSLIESKDEHRGTVGRCLHVYPDGAVKEMTIAGNRDNKRCVAFGGAVVLPRALVLAAGNWNPGLYAYEEVELYSRLRSMHCEVVYRAIPFADHHTVRLSRFRVLLGSVVPFRSILGKKYYGAGQAVAASIKGRTLTALMHTRPGPFAFTAGGLLSVLLLSMGQPVPGILIFLASVLMAVRMGGPFGPIIYATWIPQVLLGMFKYHQHHVPEIETEWSRHADVGSATERHTVPSTHS